MDEAAEPVKERVSMREIEPQLVDSELSETWGFSERYTAGVSRGIYKIYAGFRILSSVHRSPECTSAETDMNFTEDDDTGKHACIH